MKFDTRFAFAAALCVSATSLQAHDYWLEPSDWEPAPGSRVMVTHLVGEHLAGEPVGRNLAAIVRFEALLADGSALPVPLAPGAERRGVLTLTGAGPARIVYQSLSAFATLSPSKFEAYLEEEGLQHVLQQRERLGEEEKMAREAFSRSAVAVVCGGSVASAHAAKSPGAPVTPTGLELEIVPEGDLCNAAVGSELSFQLLRDGAPVAGWLVRALARDRPEADLETRTDAEGRFRLRFAKAGVWLLKAIQMERAVGMPEADWRSRWASLTFRLR